MRDSFCPARAGLNPFETKVELDVSPKGELMVPDWNNDAGRALWVI